MEKVVHFSLLIYISFTGVNKLFRHHQTIHRDSLLHKQKGEPFLLLSNSNISTTHYRGGQITLLPINAFHPGIVLRFPDNERRRIAGMFLQAFG